MTSHDPAITPDAPFRAQPSIVMSTTTPAIADGKPVVPLNWAVSSSSTTATLGTTHIHAIADPDTSLSGAGYVNPPKPASTKDAGPWLARWTVRTLPDPAHYPNGYYWLGTASAKDGTQNITAEAQLWRPDNTSKGGTPGWHSFYPFKPSVTAVNHYLQGGKVVHHPKGVNFNAHYIEHMWMNWGSAHRQPFTWVMAATVSNWGPAGYTHYLLDSGRDPSQVGFPALSDTDVDTSRVIADGLSYRNLLAVSHSSLIQCARPLTGPATTRAPIDSTLRPRMYIGIFNGASSYVGAFSPGKRVLKKGTLDNTSAQAHQYYVMGRGNNAMSQARASHLLVFEVRYWNKALTQAQLESQYTQISSTWQFDLYRGL